MRNAQSAMSNGGERFQEVVGAPSPPLPQLSSKIFSLAADMTTNSVGAYVSSSCMAALKKERDVVERASWVSASPTYHSVMWTFERSMGSHRDMCVSLVSNELDTARDYDIGRFFFLFFLFFSAACAPLSNIMTLSIDM